jgi:transcription elongation factor GreB
MSRYRPPAEASTAIITRAGFETLKTELNFLWKEKRPEVVKALAAAAAEGDRSENAEYIYRKKQLGEIDRRVRYLTKRIEQLKVVDQAPSDQSVIYFGAWFDIEHADSAEISRYRIVGPDETDAKAGFISIDSPMARAVLKKRVDDEFQVQLPTGLTKFYILHVRYSAFV